MNQYLPWIIESAVALAILGFAWLVSLSLRRAHEPYLAGQMARPIPPGRHIVWRTICRSLVILVVSVAVDVLTSLLPAVVSWKATHLAHFDAWFAFWGVVFMVRLAEGMLVAFYARRNQQLPLPDLLRSITRTLILLIAAFFIMKFILRINIAPLLASTALVTAVIGFALQGVLGNLLAGMSLHIVRSVVPGDWVRINDLAGEVMETNWRETRLRTVGGHVLLIPNSVVAGSVISNMTWPGKRRRHELNVGASYADAPAEVIAALVAAAAAVPAVLKDPPPSAYVTEFKDFGINYQLRFWTDLYYDRTPAEGDVNRMIWYQFKRRGIEIPFPMSDQLLNDFMAVVYNQRRIPPADAEVDTVLEELLRSEFSTRLFVDEQGQPLVQRDEWRAVAARVERLAYTRGETIFRQGEPGDACYVVVRGQVAGTLEYEGAQPVRHFEAGPGAVLGEMSLTTGLPRTATATAATEVDLLRISQDAFRSLLSLHAEIPEVLARLVAERGQQNSAALEHLKLAQTTDIRESLKRTSILRRFMHMLGRG